jgi:hypothetical protein
LRQARLRLSLARRRSEFHVQAFKARLFVVSDRDLVARLGLLTDEYEDQ